MPAVHKNVLPSLQQSMVVYQCVCRCDCRYVDRTSQRLQDRINQHIPRCIRSDKIPTKNLSNRECKLTTTPSVYCDSVIGQHLLENEECAKHFNDLQFSISATAKSWFHLSVLEATYTNSLQSILCRQKEFVYSLQISHYFFFTFPTKPKQYFSTNQIARVTNFDQSENRKKFFMFLYFCINLIQFWVIFAAFYVTIVTHCHFNAVNLYIYHCILVFLHSSVDSQRKLDENVQSKTAFFEATHISKSGNDSSDAIESYFEILYH